MHAIIEGRVQGVGFRATAKTFADRLKITGYARNLSNGSVEIIAQGQKKDLETFNDLLKNAFGKDHIHDISLNFFLVSESFDDFKIL